MKLVALLAALLLAAATAVAAASPRRRAPRVFDDAAALFELDARADAAEQHSLLFFVKQRDNAAADCDSLLADVSDPASPRYAQYLSYEAVGERFGGAPEHYAAVRRWLNASLPATARVEASPNREWVRVTASVAALERALGSGVAFHAYRLRAHAATRVLRAGAADDVRGLAALPADVRAHVDFVGYLSGLPHVRRASAAGAGQGPVVHGMVHVGDDDAAAAAAADLVTPQLLSQFYNVANNTVMHANATQSIYASLGQSFDPEDLAYWQQHFSLPASRISEVIGPNRPESCGEDPNNCIEASLDVQQITSMAQRRNGTTFWSIPGSDGDIFLEWIVAVAAKPNAPLVHSISYGSLAPEDPRNDMKRFNTEVCKVGLRGLTVLVASGDDGVANFRARGHPENCGFTPSFPATSPYVLAVGATQGPESGSEEIACTADAGGGITTGGGASDFFAQPAYQKAAVLRYLSTADNLPPHDEFSAGGRFYPDVALMGHNYPIAIGGRLYSGSGTSASTPAFAGLITLVNGLRLAANKKPVGFVNPALYMHIFVNHPDAFKDITKGRNNCCAGAPGEATCCEYGFPAAPGYDATTGLGSVDATKLFAALLALP